MLNNAKKGGGDNSNASYNDTETTTSITASATSAIIRYSDVYICCAGSVPVLVIRVCAFFAYTVIRDLFRPGTKSNSMNHRSI